MTALRALACITSKKVCHPLLRRLSAAFAVLLLFVATPASHAQVLQKAMAADANPSFEVATIRPSNPDKSGGNSDQMGHRVVMSGQTVMFLIGFAYDLHNKQIIGGPPWMASAKFDIDAVADTPGTPNLRQLKLMLQKLLSDRFQLQSHHDRKEMTAYVLTVSKSGSKLNNSKEDPTGLPRLMLEPGSHGLGTMRATNVTMTDFTNLLQSGILDRPVVDETGLKGRYDFPLNWTPDESQFTQVGVRVAPPSESADAPSLFTAIKDQLGLNLTAQKNALVEVFVIDKLEKPSDN